MKKFILKFFSVYLLLCLLVIELNGDDFKDMPSCAIPANTNHHKWVGPRIKKMNELALKGGFEAMLIGDSITQGWEQWGRRIWEKNIASQFSVANFGVGADKTENVLWRLENGNLKGALNPQVIILLIGTNNLGVNKPEDIAKGVKAILDKLSDRFPRAHIILFGVFPRQDNFDHLSIELNNFILKFDDKEKIHFFDIRQSFIKEGKPDSSLYADNVHLNESGYRKWADTLIPEINKWIKD